MFDHRLARVMHEDKVNAAGTRWGKKDSKSEEAASTNRKRFTIIMRIGQLFSWPVWSEVKWELSTPRNRMEKTSSR